MKTSYRKRDHASGEALLKLRTTIGLTQGRLGMLLGVSRRTVGTWETGEHYPKTDHLKQLIALAWEHQAFAPGNEAEEIRVLWKVAHQKQLLDKHWLCALLSGQRNPLPHMRSAGVEETRSLLPVRALGASESGEDANHETETHSQMPLDQDTPMIHNLPFPPNPFFTGRETDLLRISQLFLESARIAITQPLSVSGLGGIGKTQLALEYAHRCHPHIYRSVLWVNAADKTSLETSYLALAHLLKLPERQEPEVDRIVQAFKSWLEDHTNWLLILDNADDLELARSYLPTKPRGHILLTTRSQIVGSIATRIQVESLSAEEGLLFLLRRCGVLPSGTEPLSIEADIRHAAAELVEMLSSHPLALDQAGAYIEETSDPEARATGASFTEYKQLYQAQRRTLLKRRGALGGEHPESVALTIEISAQKACQRHPKCAEVLAFCSLLHPDAIPEELFHQGLSLDLLHFNEVTRALRSTSLIKRNAQKQVLSLHRLVQAVIRDGMDRQTLQRWTERVVQVLNEAFPEVTFEAWPQCERYLPHVLVCTNWREEHEATSPRHTERLLSKAGIYLRSRGQYSLAEPLLVRALSLREQHLGAEHPDTAPCLNNLAILYWKQGKYELAEPLYQRALAIRKQHLGAEHPDTAISLNNLATLYWHQGRSELAEPLLAQALAFREQHLGAEHPDTARSLNNLANLYKEQGKYSLAEPLYQRAVSIKEQHLGAEHPNTAISLNNLADLYREQGKGEQAELLYQRVLAICKQHLGAEHPDTAIILNNLATLYREQDKYSLAEPLYRQALAIFEQHLEAEHPLTAYPLHGLAEIAQHQGKHEQAEALYCRALAIREKRLGIEHPETANSLNDLANLYREQGKDSSAELLSQRVFALQEQPIPAQDPQQEVGGVEAPIAESSGQADEPDRPAQERQKRQSHIVPVIGNAQAKARVQEPVVSREVFTREITFTCMKCGQTVTQQRYPSHTPLYCSDACSNEARKEQTRKRVARLRERRRQVASNAITQESVTK